MPRVPQEIEGSGEPKLVVRVTGAESVTGDCTYVLSRGKQRVVFELTIKLALEMERYDKLSEEIEAIQQRCEGLLEAPAFDSAECLRVMRLISDIRSWLPAHESTSE